MTNKKEIIFFGNGPLADATLNVLKNHFNIIFHAKTKADLGTVIELKKSHPDASGVLASYGVLIKSDVLDLFEPEGILNLHPSLLPKYRGPSPIENAILNGDTTFGLSIMKLVKAMDAGPLYHQETLTFDKTTPKFVIYETLARAGATWLVQNLAHVPTPTPQDDTKATFTHLLDKSLSPLNPAQKTAEELLDQIRAFATFPTSKFTLYGLDCIIHSAHISDTPTPLSLKCKDGKYLAIDTIQPAGKKVMDAKSFLNGYAKTSH